RRCSRARLRQRAEIGRKRLTSRQRRQSGQNQKLFHRERPLTAQNPALRNVNTGREQASTRPRLGGESAKARRLSSAPYRPACSCRSTASATAGGRRFFRSGGRRFSRAWP